MFTKVPLQSYRTSAFGGREKHSPSQYLISQEAALPELPNFFRAHPISKHCVYEIYTYRGLLSRFFDFMYFLQTA